MAEKDPFEKDPDPEGTAKALQDRVAELREKIERPRARRVAEDAQNRLPYKDPD